MNNDRYNWKAYNARQLFLLCHGVTANSAYVTAERPGLKRAYSAQEAAFESAWRLACWEAGVEWTNDRTTAATGTLEELPPSFRNRIPIILTCPTTCSQGRARIEPCNPPSLVQKADRAAQ